MCAGKYLGLKKYLEVDSLQNKLSAKIRHTKSVEVLGMEFEPVITLGIRGNQGCDLIRPQSETPIPIVTTDRGGQATLHGPGQLVIYPIMDLKEYGLGARDFVCLIHRATSRLLKFYGIDTQSGPAPGLYTDVGKIAFLGIRIDRGVVKHGLAINISNDLGNFNFIKSCGVFSASLDKLQNYSPEAVINLAVVFKKWVTEFEMELENFKPS